MKLFNVFTKLKHRLIIDKLENIFSLLNSKHNERNVIEFNEIKNRTIHLNYIMPNKINKINL